MQLLKILLLLGEASLSCPSLPEQDLTECPCTLWRRKTKSLTIERRALSSEPDFTACTCEHLLSNSLIRGKPGKRVSQSTYHYCGRNYYGLSGLWRMSACNEMGLSLRAEILPFCLVSPFPFLLTGPSLYFRERMRKIKQMKKN